MGVRNMRTSTAKLHYYLIIIATLLFLNTSCTTVIPKYKLPSDNLNQTDLKSDVKFTVRPLVNPDESEKYFGNVLLSEGIIAIFLKIENQSDSSHYKVDKNEIWLSVLPTKGNEEILSKDRGDAQSNDYTFGASAMLAQMAINESRKEFALRSNEYRTRTIPPRGRAQGFLYFKYSGKQEDLGDLKLHIKAVDPVERKGIYFDFNIMLTKG